MFLVDDVLVSDDVLNAPFVCNLSACKGGCCVQGESGAPLELDELSQVEESFPKVAKYLQPEALKVIESDGLWEKDGRDSYGTTCVDDAECVFVTYENNMAKCSFQIAYQKGEIDFPKPISCHLFPIRISHNGEHEVLNYEQIQLCNPAIKFGRKNDVMLPAFLSEPLIRKYGQEWYNAFVESCAERAESLAS